MYLENVGISLKDLKKSSKTGRLELNNIQTQSYCMNCSKTQKESSSAKLKAKNRRESKSVKPKIKLSESSKGKYMVGLFT